MLGVVPAALIGGKGTIWMLGTEGIYREGRSLMQLGPPVFAHWLETFTRLENIVMPSNTRAVRLLKRWGFTVGQTEQVHGGETFVPFWMDRTIQGAVPTP